MGDRYVEAIERAIMAMTFASGMPEVAAAYDFTDAIKGLAAAHREQDRWYEMDDPEHPAPRDGTELIGLARDGNIFRIWQARTPRGTPAWVSYGGAFVDGYITHYRHLPAPPLSGRKPASSISGEPRG
jgi:hypothetical protein